MINLSKRVLAGLWAGAGLLSLVSCGGGAEPASRSLSQSIAFSSPGEQRFGTLPAALVATASSGLPVDLSTSTPAVCTVSGTRLALLGVGTCTVTAQQPGDLAFAPAATLTSSFDVAVGVQSIIFVAPGNQALNTAPAALVASASSGLAVSFASRSPAVCSVTGSTLTLLGLGTCMLDAIQAGNTNVQAAPVVSQRFTVASGLLSQSINFAALGKQTLGSAAPALAATASSGLAVNFVATTADTCSVNGTTLTLQAAGTCSVAASQAGDTRFAAAVAVINSFTVLPTAQSISVTGPGNQTLGSPTSPLAASASSGLPVSFASSSPDVCTTSGNTLVLVSAGLCTLRASQGGNANFAAATPVSVSITVLPTPQTISFAAPASQTLGSAPSALVATASSGLAVSLASTTPSVCTVSGGSLTLVATGTCSLSASQPGNAAFAAAPTVLRSLSVAAAALIVQTLSFSAPGNQTLGAAPLLLSATASSGLAVALASTTTTVCTLSGTSLTLVALGICSITASQAGNAIYAAALPVQQAFAVGSAPLLAQTIGFSTPADQTLGTLPAALVASASSGLAVSLASTTPAVCTASSSTLSLLAAGTCTINASQAGNLIFAAATPVARSFTVVAAAQSISFNSPGTQTVGNSVKLVASASSGLAVSFSADPTAVCSVSGSSLTLLTAGTCTISANQAGNGAFAAASTVSQRFTSAIEYFANGGFETLGSTTPAFGWLNAASGYSRSVDARSGGFSARLASPAFSAAVMLQNSLEQGLRPVLTVAQSPTLTFWAKGNAGGTGNVLFALRYLDSVGNILANSSNQFFHTLINPNTWTKITYNLGPVPVGAVAAFIEFSQGIGPIDGSNPAGVVLIDDLSLRLP